jgi:hypothetical protein
MTTDFGFAVIADPHIDGSVGHLPKFEAVIDWCIEHRVDKNIKMAWIVGDIAWGPGNLAIAKAALDELNEAGIPYIPVMGDNEVQSGYENEFATVFAPQYEYLASEATDFVNFQKQAPPPPPNDGCNLQNFVFEYEGCRFVGLDVASRVQGDESGDLHQFAGGTLDWMSEHIPSYHEQLNGLNIFSHMGMFRTGIPIADQYLFTDDDMTIIKNLIVPCRLYVAANYSGHIHQNWSAQVYYWIWKLYKAYVTDDTWNDVRFPETSDDRETVRVVGVNHGWFGRNYTQEIIDVI